MSKPLSILILVIAGALTLWRSSQALIGLWDYLRLDAQATAQIKSWQSQQISSTQFAPSASYSYEWEGEERNGSSHLPPPYYPNRFAAEEVSAHEKLGNRLIWIDSSHPSYTALERRFPVKSSIYAVCSLAIFLYFLYVIQFSAGAAEKRGGKK